MVDAGARQLGRAVACRYANAKAAGEFLVLREYGKHAGLLERRLDVLGRFGLLPQEVGDGAQEEGDGAVVRGDVGPEIGVGVALAQDHGRAADHAGIDDGPLAAHVEQGQARVVEHVLGLKVEDLRRRMSVGEGMGVGGHDTLRGTRGARGIHDADEIVERRRRLERCRIGREQLGEARSTAALGQPGRQRDVLGRGRVFAVDDAAFEVLELGLDILEAVEVGAVDDDGLGTRIVADALEYAAAIGEVHGHLDGAPLGEAAPQGDEVRRVGQHEQYRLLVLDSEGGDAVGHAVGERVEPSICDLFTGHALDQRLIRTTLGAPREHLSDRPLLELESAALHGFPPPCDTTDRHSLSRPAHIFVDRALVESTTSWDN